MSDTEQSVQSKIIAFLKAHDIFHFKTVVTNKAGIPDIIVCHKGRFVGIEVKAPKGRLTPLQTRTLEQIQASGGSAMVATSVDDVKRFLGVA